MKAAYNGASVFLELYWKFIFLQFGEVVSLFWFWKNKVLENASTIFIFLTKYMTSLHFLELVNNEVGVIVLC